MANGSWKDEIACRRILGEGMSILRRLEAEDYEFEGHWLNAEEENWANYLHRAMEVCVERGYQKRYERMLWIINNDIPDNPQATWEEAVQWHQECLERSRAMDERLKNMGA